MDNIGNQIVDQAMSVSEMYPSIATDGFDPGGADRVIFTSWCRDGNLTWSDPQVLSNTSLPILYEIEPKVVSNGLIFFIFWDSTLPGYDHPVYRRSDDAGKTWGPIILFPIVPGPSNQTVYGIETMTPLGRFSSTWVGSVSNPSALDENYVVVSDDNLATFRLSRIAAKHTVLRWKIVNGQRSFMLFDVDNLAQGVTVQFTDINFGNFTFPTSCFQVSLLGNARIVWPWNLLIGGPGANFVFPYITSDLVNRIWVIYCRVSTTVGIAWGPQLTVYTQTMSQGEIQYMNANCGPRGECIIAWSTTDGVDPNFTTAVRYVFSSDSGFTWGSPIDLMRLPQPDPGFGFFEDPRIAFDPFGLIMIAINGQADIASEPVNVFAAGLGYSECFANGLLNETNLCKTSTCSTIFNSRNAQCLNGTLTIPTITLNISYPLSNSSLYIGSIDIADGIILSGSSLSIANNLNLTGPQSLSITDSVLAVSGNLTLSDSSTLVISDSLSNLSVYGCAEFSGTLNLTVIPSGSLIEIPVATYGCRTGTFGTVNVALAPGYENCSSVAQINPSYKASSLVVIVSLQDQCGQTPASGTHGRGCLLAILLLEWALQIFVNS